MTNAQGSGVTALLRDYVRFAGTVRLGLVLTLMLLGAAAEGFGILMLVPLASIAVGSADLPRGLGSVEAILDELGSGNDFALVLGLFIAAMALRALVTYARDVQLAELQSGYESSLRLRAAATLARRGWSFAARIGQAGMQSLLLSDVPRAALGVSQAQRFAISSIMLAVQLGVAALLSITLAAVAVAIVAAGLLLSVGRTRRAVGTGLALVERSEHSTSSGFRLHSGLKAALAQGTVGQFLAEYRSSLGSARRELVRFLSDVAAARSLAFLGSALAAGALFFIGHQLLELPFAVLVTSLVLFARMAGPAQSLQQTAQNLAAYGPSFAAIERRLGKLERVEETEQSAEPLEWTELRVEQARFEHQPGLGLHGASLALRSGEWLGVGGPSGSGKTTLIDLVAGLIQPQSGTITVDGQPLSPAIAQGWRAGLAYVGQEGAVFDDSVRGNLCVDRPGAAEEQLWDALELVGLVDRVRAFPGGLDERVGDRGSALSGGERQRLVIARALLRRPRLLLLDEATAALDAAGEAALLDRLRELQPRPSAIVIAHRPSTLAHCDSQITIQHGEVRKNAGRSAPDG